MFRILKGLLIFILLMSLITVTQAASVNGTLYDWSDFEKPLKNVIVEVLENSTKINYKVSLDGTYYFPTSPGNYTIRAKYYKNNILELTGEDNVQIEKPDETRNIDIILFPPTNLEDEYLRDVNLTDVMDNKQDNSLPLYAFITIILIICSILFFYWIKKKNTKPEEPKPHTERSQTAMAEKGLPDDLKDLYDLIIKTGGRTTQKDLRKKMSCSEAKVSLMLDDLENRGFIKKIKKGRSNVILAENHKI
jgi:uncharacterized membrane protein